MPVLLTRRLAHFFDRGGRADGDASTQAWSDKDKGGAWNSLALAAGFALFALLSQLFES